MGGGGRLNDHMLFNTHHSAAIKGILSFTHTEVLVFNANHLALGLCRLLYDAALHSTFVSQQR